MRIVLLNDLETWSAADGCKLVDVPDGWSSEDIDNTLVGDDDDPARIDRINQMLTIPLFDMLASGDEHCATWRQHMIAGLVLLRAALADLPPDVRAIATNYGALDLVHEGQIEMWIWELKGRQVPLTREERGG